MSLAAVPNSGTFGVLVSAILDILVRDCQLAEIVFRYSTNPTGRDTIEISEASLYTRRALTRGAISWLCDSKRNSNVYLIHESVPGDYGNVESYRADVVAKICCDAQRSGGFFCHVRKSDDVAKLSTELAVTYAPYRHILTQTLIDYPEIRRLPQRALFKKLILEPWKAIQHSHPGYITAPPVIVLTWLNSCDEDLPRLICEFGSPPHSSPLLWIISLGPKCKLPIQDLVEPFAPRYIRPPICYNEAREDALLFLHERFGDLRRKYDKEFNENEVWPSDEQMAQLARVVLGAFEFINVIIQFVDGEGDGGPRAHLETFLGYMVDSPPPSDEQWYSALDHFYIRALSSIPPDVLDVKEAFSIILWGYEIGLAQMLSLVSFRFDTFLPYFYHLVSNPECHWKKSCTKHFRHFVEDRSRSGQFYIPTSESYLRAYQAWLHFLSHSSDLRIILKPGVLRLSQADLTNGAKQLWDLRRRAVLRLCDMEANKALLLRHFDFRCLAQNCDSIEIEDFASFINDLYEVSTIFESTIFG
jgi:hypothetical protein